MNYCQYAKRNHSVVSEIYYFLSLALVELV